MNLQENIQRIKEVMGTILEDTNQIKYDAVLVGGLEDGKSLIKQLDYFKQGFGANRNVMAFSYYTETSKIFEFMKKNPKTPIFLFSAGCRKSGELSSNPNVDNRKLYIIEPYTVKESGETTKSVRRALENGVPISNVYVGNTSSVGGNIEGAVKTNSKYHFDALTIVGSIHRNTKN